MNQGEFPHAVLIVPKTATKYPDCRWKWVEQTLRTPRSSIPTVYEYPLPAPKGYHPRGLRLSSIRYTYATPDFEVEYLMDFDPRDFEDEALILCAIFVWLIITVVLK